MLRGRAGLLLLIAVFTAGTAGAQQPAEMPRIGWLQMHGAAAGRDAAFLDGLRELGYVDGQNLIIERRDAQGQLDRLPGLAAELVRLNVAVLLALQPPGVLAARHATQTIPIVMRYTDDPVEAGLVDSLARPGGNITGVTSYSTNLIAKRLELLREVAPEATRVAVLYHPILHKSGQQKERAQAAARELGLQLRFLPVSHQRDLEAAFETAFKERLAAVVPLRSPPILIGRKLLAELALSAGLPAIYDDREFVEDGGLISYGANLAESYRRAAIYVDRILKGASPAELPVEQPTRFELWVNLKTARQMGFTVSADLLLRADHVIK